MKKTLSSEGTPSPIQFSFLLSAFFMQILCLMGKNGIMRISDFCTVKTAIEKNNMTAFHETIKRSVLKSITFRIVVVVSDLIVIFALTHRYDLTIGVTIGTNIASMVLYYLHERVWNGIHFGKKVKKEKQKKDLYV